MTEPVHPGSPGKIRFGALEFDSRTGELRKHGVRVRLQQQPLQALLFLLEHRGEVVTRESLRQQLWGDDTFVEFDDSLNHVIKRLRDSLADSAGSPRFIETVPGRGYRFVAPIEVLEESATPGSRTAAPAVYPLNKMKWLAAPAAVFALIALAIGWLGVPGEAPRSSPSHAVPPAKASVVVLPFTNLTGDPAQEFFADGMTDVLISELAKVGALRVISRTSSMQYKGVEKSLPEMATDLNASHVVEGSIVRSADQVRITAQLIEAATDVHLWSENYVRNPADIVALQGEVARAVAKAVQIELTPEEELRLAAARPVSPEVYQSYLKGRSLSEAGDTVRAIEQFHRTIEMDPDYAPAYSWLADNYIRVAWWTGPPTELSSKARIAALKAIELDDTLAEPYLLLAKIRAFYDWQWEQAETDFLKALERNPNHTGTYQGYALYLAVVGRLDEAVAMAQRAVEVDPLSAWTLAMAGDIEYFAGNYDRAVALYAAALEMRPDGALWHAMLGCIKTEMGRYEEAIAHLERSVPNAGEDLRPKMIMAWSYARAGNRARALEILKDVERDSAATNWSHYHRAFVYAALEDYDRAFSLLNHAIEERWGFIGTVAVLPPYAAIHSHPGYPALLKKIGLDRLRPVTAARVAGAAKGLLPPGSLPMKAPRPQ